MTEYEPIHPENSMEKRELKDQQQKKRSEGKVRVNKQILIRLPVCWFFSLAARLLQNAERSHENLTLIYIRGQLFSLKGHTGF